MLRYLGAVAVALASSSIAAPPNFRAKADALIAELAPSANAGTAAVVSEKGRVLWTGASGLADVKSGTPLKANDIFGYGSITKQFTAALVLKLVAEKKFSLEDTLGTLLSAETPTAWHAVTVRQLLNHTSGIPSNTDQPSFGAPGNLTRKWTTQQLVDMTRELPLNFVPGTDFRYNNTGYTVLASLIEKTTGKPWHDALRERITGPLKLNSIRCGCTANSGLVAGHTAGSRPAMVFDLSIPSAAGALVGNATDLAAWAEALHGGKVVPPALYREMVAPTRLPDGRTIPYGFGIAPVDFAGEAAIGHGGAGPGFISDSLYLPKRRLFAAMLVNTDTKKPDPEHGIRRLLALAADLPLPSHDETPASAAAFSGHLGDYLTMRGPLRLMEREGKVYVRYGPASQEVFATSKDPNIYHFGKRSMDWFRLGRDNAGKPKLDLFFNASTVPMEAVWTRGLPNLPRATPTQP